MKISKRILTLFILGVILGILLTPFTTPLLTDSPERENLQDNSQIQNDNIIEMEKQDPETHEPGYYEINKTESGPKIKTYITENKTKIEHYK